MLLLVLLCLACCAVGAPTPNKHVIDELNKIFSNLDSVKWNNQDRVDRLFQGLWKDLKPLKTQELSFTDDEKFQIAEIIRSIRLKRFPKPAPAQEWLKNLIAKSMEEIHALLPEVPLAAQSRVHDGSVKRSIPTGHAQTSSKPLYRSSTSVSRMLQKSSKPKLVPKSKRSGSQSSDTCSLDSVTSPRTVLRETFLKDSLHRAQEKKAKLERSGSSSLHSISEDSSTVDDFKSFMSECKADAHFVGRALDVKDVDSAFTDDDFATVCDKDSVSKLDCALDGPALDAQDSDSSAPLIDDDLPITHQDYPESKLHIDASVRHVQRSLPTASLIDNDAPFIIEATDSQPGCLFDDSAPDAQVSIASLVAGRTDATLRRDDSDCKLRCNTDEPHRDAEDIGSAATLDDDDDCIGVVSHKQDPDCKLQSHADENVSDTKAAALDTDCLNFTFYEKGSSSRHNGAATLQDRDSNAPSSASDHTSFDRDDASYLSSFLIAAGKVFASSSTCTGNEATKLPSPFTVYQAYNNPLFDDHSFDETLEADALNLTSSAVTYAASHQNFDQLVKYHFLQRTIADETNAVSGPDLEIKANGNQDITSPDDGANPGGFNALESDVYDREHQISQVILNASTDQVNQAPLTDPPASELHILDHEVAASADLTKNACKSLSSGSEIAPGAIQDQEVCCQEVALPTSVSDVVHQERFTNQSAADLSSPKQDEESFQIPLETTSVYKAAAEAPSDTSNLKEDEETDRICSAITEGVHQEQLTNQAAADSPSEGDLSSVINQDGNACCESLSATIEGIPKDHQPDGQAHSLHDPVKRDGKICWKTIAITSATTLGVAGVIGAALRLLWLRYRWSTKSISV